MPNTQCQLPTFLRATSPEHLQGQRPKTPWAAVPAHHRSSEKKSLLTNTQPFGVGPADLQRSLTSAVIPCGFSQGRAACEGRSNPAGSSARYRARPAAGLRARRAHGAHPGPWPRDSQLPSRRPSSFHQSSPRCRHPQIHHRSLTAQISPISALTHPGPAAFVLRSFPAPF